MYLRGVEQRIPFKALDATDGVNPKTGVTSWGYCRISKNGGAFAAATNAPSEAGLGWYSIVLTAAEMDAETVVLEFAATGAVIAGVPIHTEANYTADRAAYLDAAISSRMAAYTQPTGFLAATFPATVAAPGDAMALTSGERTTLAAAIWNALTSGMATAGSIGKKLADWVVGTLTSDERTSIANEVEAQIIDETDSEKVLTAITDKIASANPDLSGLTLSAIAAAVWSAGTRVLTAGTNIVLAKGTGVTGFTDLDAAGMRSALGLASANVDTQLAALQSSVNSAVAVTGKLDTTLELDGMSYRFTAAALALAPTGGGSAPTADENAAALLTLDWTTVTGEADRSVLNALRFIRNGFSTAGSTLSVLKEDDTTVAYTRNLATDAAADPIVGVS